MAAPQAVPVQHITLQGNDPATGPFNKAIVIDCLAVAAETGRVKSRQVETFPHTKNKKQNDADRTHATRWIAPPPESDTRERPPAVSGSSLSLLVLIAEIA